MAENQEKPKIIVDDDWKTQARAEKEKLSQQAEKAPEPGAQATRGGETPAADFGGMVNALVSNIVFALGGIEDPNTGKRFMDLQLAKHYIDLLAVLEEKTRGNLSDSEKKLLDSALYEIRMQYVQIAQRLTQV